MHWISEQGQTTQQSEASTLKHLVLLALLLLATTGTALAAHIQLVLPETVLQHCDVFMCDGRYLIAHL
jgi:hypothetical protein